MWGITHTRQAYLLCTVPVGVWRAQEPDESSSLGKAAAHLLTSEPHTVPPPHAQENRRAYRELFCTAEGLGQAISGAILFKETLFQSSSDGRPFVDCLLGEGILPGVKVDEVGGRQAWPAGLRADSVILAAEQTAPAPVQKDPNMLPLLMLMLSPPPQGLVPITFNAAGETGTRGLDNLEKHAKEYRRCVRVGRAQQALHLRSSSEQHWQYIVTPAPFQGPASISSKWLPSTCRQGKGGGNSRSACSALLTGRARGSPSGGQRSRWARACPPRQPSTSTPPSSRSMLPSARCGCRGMQACLLLGMPAAGLEDMGVLSCNAGATHRDVAPALDQTYGITPGQAAPAPFPYNLRPATWCRLWSLRS